MIGLIAWILVVIGGLNWGLVGVFNFNLVETIFGTGAFASVIYAIVGVAAVYMAFMPPKRKMMKGGM
jgi:hypothetical protein